MHRKRFIMEKIKSIIAKAAKEDRMLSSKESNEIFHICEMNGILIDDFIKVNKCDNCISWDEIVDYYGLKF